MGISPGSDTAAHSGARDCWQLNGRSWGHGGSTNSDPTVDFLAMDLVPESYDLLTFVAVLHHMDLDRAPSNAPYCSVPAVLCLERASQRGRPEIDRAVGPIPLLQASENL